jgi:hypothetical protein
LLAYFDVISLHLSRGFATSILSAGTADRPEELGCTFAQ